MITTQGASDPEVHVMEDPSTEVDISKKTPDFGPSNTIFKAGDSVEFTATPKSQPVVSGSKAVATETNLFEKEKVNPINYLEPLSGHYVQEPHCTHCLKEETLYQMQKTYLVRSFLVKNVRKCFLMKRCTRLMFKLNTLIIRMFTSV